MLIKKYIVKYSYSNDYELIVEAVSENHAKEIFHAIMSQEIEDTNSDMDIHDIKISDVKPLH